MPLTGFLIHFAEIWQTLTRDQEVVKIEKGWEMLPLSKPFQNPIPKGKGVSQKGEW